MTYSFRIADGDLPTMTEVFSHRRDNRRIKEQRKEQRSNRIHRLYEAMRAAKPLTTISVLLAISPLLAIHSIYA